MRPSPADTASMRRALALAEEAASAGEVPVGAIVLDASGSVVGQARNRREETHDPSAHAEVLALREAASAIALDPSNVDALATVAKLLVDVPDEVPREAQAGLDAAATAARATVTSSRS